MKRVNRDTWISMVLIIIFSYTLYEGKQLGEMSGIFPVIVNLVLIILSIFYFIKSLSNTRNGKLFADVSVKNVVIFISGMAVYGSSIWLFGFLISSLAVVGGLIFFLQDDERTTRKLLKASISSAIFCGSFYMLFTYIFLVPLPNGEILYYLFGI